jgi:predicted enzyme related to lactoylglutathione lyase
MNMAVTAEQLGIHSLGWFVRRSQLPPADLAAFYKAAWGLPTPRPPGPTGSMMLWAGDVTMLEISTLTSTPGTQSRADEMSVGMRTTAFPAALSRMRDAGASLVAEHAGPPRTAMLADPDGKLLGLEETRSDNPSALQLPDSPPLPTEIAGIARVTLRAADPAGLAEFYQNTLGLTLQGEASANGAVLSLGRGVVLELRPGGHRHAAPTDRKEVPDVWILRVNDHDALAARFESMNVQIINQVRITGGILSYVVDPEGHLFGIQQRSPDLLPADKPERVEDRLARGA